MKIMVEDGAFDPVRAHDDSWWNAKCPICGKRFHLKPSKLAKDKNHYCSRDCHKEAKKAYMAGEGNHQYGLKGEKNASWKGGKKYTNYGYYMICVPGHPFGEGRTNYVFEHRLVAEKYLLTEENSVEINGKRYLKPEYDVHHIDFDRTNNDVSNLVVMKKSDHRRLHSKLNKRERSAENGQFVKQKGTVLFKKVTETAKIPERATAGSAGYDMYAEIQEPLTIPPGKSVMIRSGIAMSAPRRCAGFIFARSGLSTKQGLRPSTCVSVIDTDYRGEIGLPIYNDSDEEQTIMPHERIAQLVFIPVLKPTIEIVKSLDETDRGTQGFGSSGK